MKLPEKSVLYKKCKSYLGGTKRGPDADFLQTAQPVLYLAARQTGSVVAFFQTVAKACQLEYQPTVPLKIFEKHSLVQQIGLDVTSKYLFFPYYEGSTLVIATADPYPRQEIVAYCKERLACTDIKFVICPPHVIWSALNHSNYIPAQELAELHLHRTYPEYSSKEQSYLFVRIVLLAIVLVVAGSVFFSAQALVLAFLVIVNLVYAVLNPIKLGMALGAFKMQLQKVLPKQLRQLKKSKLPNYTILVPLKDEADSIPELLDSLTSMAYPPEKLDVKFAVEVTDEITLAALEKAGVSVHENEPKPAYSLFQVVKVPVESLSTKPRSCNYALQFARGEVVVIYDAEDKPDPLQLQQAYQVFLESKLNTICIQAKLNYYNPHQNILTRCFTAEYTFWFDVLLPALNYWGVPLPLGGTSNHFQTRALKAIGTWDPYNVTEDAEVGWRLSRLGYQTIMMDSYTWEEANSDTWNWIRQRTRWQKGFLLTLLVHLRKPQQLIRDLGWRAAFFSSIVFATTVILPVINLWLWLYTALWIYSFFGPLPMALTYLTGWVAVLSIVNLIFGNLFYVVMHAVGLAYTKQWSLFWILPVLPLYWLLQSASSYRSLWQVSSNPYLWEKTVHGLHRKAKQLAH